MVKAKKSLGQNFLIDSKYISKIVESINENKSNLIIEIGPGQGAVTNYLCDVSEKVIAIEIDDRMIPILNNLNKKNLSILNEDVLKVNFKTFKSQKITIVGNLPYYITSPIIKKLLEEIDEGTDIIIMVQKEVADRILANSKTKQKGAFTVYCQTMAIVERVIDVPAKAFNPKPKVNSTILKLTKKNISHYKYDKWVNYMFLQKRKTLANNLTKSLNLEKSMIIKFLTDNNISDKARAEELENEKILYICERLEQWEKELFERN